MRPLQLPTPKKYAAASLSRPFATTQVCSAVPHRRHNTIYVAHEISALAKLFELERCTTLLPLRLDTLPLAAMAGFSATLDFLPAVCRTRGMTVRQALSNELPIQSVASTATRIRHSPVNVSIHAAARYRKYKVARKQASENPARAADAVCG